jgi:serine/threonine protein kinase/putative intracellular protease/amidase
MAVTTCPSTEALAAFARGELADTELACVSEHVGTCGACCAALRAVPHDSLAELARAAALEPPTVKSEIEPVTGKPAGRVTVDIPAGFEGHARYRIVGALGAGGMGTVYKAEDELMGRVVALKVVSAHLTAKPGAVARFRREIRAAAQLKDDHIVTAYDAGEAGGSHFLVMEYVEGVSLDRLVAKKGPLPVNLACNFVRQAALGLKHAADKGMVHRDIKPQNLMVTRKGRVKILDFGLARFASSDESDAPADRPEFGEARKQADDGVTNPNLLMGTPDYLSPEQAKNSHTVDARSDLYSLGCTLHFLLAGRAPFAGAGSLIDKLLAHTTEEPPAVRAARPDVPDALAGVLAKLMAKSADDRYQTAHEVAAALLPFTRSEPAEPQFEIVEAVPVVAPPAITPAPVVPLLFAGESVPNGPTLVEAPKPRKKKRRTSWARRHRTKLVAGGLLLLFVLAASSKKETDKPTESDPAATAKAEPKANPVPPPDKGARDKGDKNDKGAKAARPNPWAGGTVIDGKGKTLLFVIPSDGVYLPDYQPVRRRLSEAGVTVKTASGDGGVSKSLENPTGPGVAVDLSFRELHQTTWKQFDAVAFCGYKCEEYVGLHPKGATAGRLIKTSLDEGKPVGAICVGVGVLAEHGALANRDAARPPQLEKDWPRLFGPLRRINWKREGVVADGKIVTAAGPEDAVPFADALLKLLNGK